MRIVRVLDKSQFPSDSPLLAKIRSKDMSASECKDMSDILLKPAEWSLLPPACAEFPPPVDYSHLVYCCLLLDNSLANTQEDIDRFASLVHYPEDMHMGYKSIYEGKWIGLVLCEFDLLSRPYKVRGITTKGTAKQFLKDCIVRTGHGESVEIDQDVCLDHHLDLAQESPMMKQWEKDRKVCLKEKERALQAELKAKKSSSKADNEPLILKLGRMTKTKDNRTYPHEDIDLMRPPAEWRHLPKTIKEAKWTSTDHLAPILKKVETPKHLFESQITTWLFLITFGY